MGQTPRTALITGAAHRIGRALALALAADGWAVAVHYRASRTEAVTLAAEINAAGGKAAILPADLSDVAAVQALPQACAEAFSPPSLLLNNASLFEDDTLHTATPQSWDAHMACNLRAPVFLTQAFAQIAPPGSNVINIIDQRVLRPTPDFFSYAASKAGLWVVTRTMAQALAPHIRVNAIGPGPVMQSVHQTPEDFAAECDSTLLKRGVDVADIVAAVRFILAAPSMTGQMIALDSGQHLS
jgi:NAD(P)-dependent dehydrogenase (short-subunit alcohol dehydrogenase family)